MSSEAASSSGNTTVIENVEFRATAPATRLPGLDNAQRKLEALSAAIKQVQSQLAGISSNSMFKLSRQQYANFAYNQKGELSAGVGQVARRAGFGPEAVRDIRQSAARMVSEVHDAIGKIEREIARNPGFKKRALAARQQQIQDLKNFLPFTNSKATSFKSAGAAGMFFGGGLEESLRNILGQSKLPKGFSFSGVTRAFLEKGYAGVALANRERGESALRGIFSGTVHDNGPAVYSPSTMAAAVKQAINETAKAVKEVTKASKETKAESRPKPAASSAPGEPKITQAQVDEVLQQHRELQKKRDAVGTTKEAKATKEWKDWHAKAEAEYSKWARMSHDFRVQEEVAVASSAGEAGEPASGSGGGKKRKGKGGGGGGDGGQEERTLVPEEGPEVERRVEETPNAEDRITTTRRLGSHTTQAALEQEGKVLKLTTRELTEKATADALRTHLAKLKREYLRDLPLAGNRGTPVTYDEHGVRRGGGYEKLRADYSAAAEKSFAAYGTHHRPMLDQYLHETMPEAEQKEMARAGEQRKKLLKQRYLAEQKDDQVKRANIQAEIDALEDHRKAMGKYNQSGQRAAKDIARERKKTAAFTQKQQMQSLFNTASTQGAMDVEADLVRRGAKLQKENFDQLTGRRTGATYHMTENGWLNKYRVDYKKEGDATARLVSSLPAVKKNHDRLDQAMEGLTARNMAANLVKVSAWSAAVMVLYKSAELAGYSMRQLVQTSTEMAHLDVVFRGVGGTVQELTTDMLRLAAVEGRATSETMQSAQSWARLGGDRKTINEEVRVSAEAANIANMHMAETSKQLQSLMHIYHLEASDLDSTLGGLVATSLRYNVTLEEMFTGLDRSAAAARVAGISLAELQGMLAVVTGTTGATGSTTGNALKYVFQELNKSEVQQTLRDKYKVETLDDKLNQKPVGQTLGELAGIWGTLGDRSKQALGGTLGGRFNAARVPVVIEQYPEILKQAIDSQLGLNSAQTANAKIVNTIRANMAGLRAEYDRLIMSGNVLSRVNLFAAVGKNIMHDVADRFSGPAPSDAQQTRLNETMQSNINKHPFWSQVMGIARTAGQFTTLGSHGLNLIQGPGMMDYNKYLHDQDAGVDLAREDRLEKFRQRERAGALRGQSFGIAKTMLENGTMTDVNANVFAETMRGMGPEGVANATAFLNARGSNDQQGAMAAVSRASTQSYDEQHKALDSRNVMLKVERQRLEKDKALNEDAITARGQTGKDATPEQLKLKDDLSRKLLQNRDAVESLDGAYEELEGTIDTVQVTQQKYLNLLKTQEGLMAGIEERFKMVEAHSPAQKLAQEVAALTAQVSAAKQAMDDFDATGDNTTEGKAARAQMVDRWKKLQADLASAQARSPQATLLTAEQRGVVQSENLGRAANYGYDEADKLLRVRAELTRDAARVEAELSRTVEGTIEHEELFGRLSKDNALVYEHTLELARRRADVEAEIHQLAIDQNREFSRSFFGAGAADMLRKLAAFKLALSGGISQGQLYSMGPAMRQDVGNLTGMNPEMTRLLFERNRLQGFANGGYTGNGNPNEIAGVVHKGEYVIPAAEMKRLDPTYAAMQRMGLDRHASRLWPTQGTTIPSSEVGRLDPVHGALRWAMGLGNSVAKRKPVSAAVQAARDRYQQQMLAMNDPATANPFFNSAKITPENFNTVFEQSHSSVFGGPRAGVHAHRGIPLDDIDALHAPPAGGLHMAPPSQTWGEELRELLGQAHGSAGGTAPSLRATLRNAASGGWSAARGAAAHGWTAARGFMSNPKHWANMGKGLGMGVLGAGVTGGLNWAGHKAGIGGSDTYGGAAYGLFADAAGGATMGARGGGLGMAIGAVGGMALGTGARLFGGVRDLNRATFGDIPMHQQVNAAQQAMLQRQRERADAAVMPAPHHLKFNQHPDDAARERKYAAAMSAADAASARWHAFKDKDKPHAAEVPHPHVAAAHAAAGPTRTGNNSAVMPVVRPAAGGGSAPAANGGDDTAIKNATAALDLLATTAGKLNTAFAALATRADALFKGGGNGLQFQPTGQMGGSYPGKTH